MKYDDFGLRGYLVEEHGTRLIFFAHQYGLKYWQTDLSDYIAVVQREQMRAWRINSAIGVGGFVIARSIAGSA